MAEDEAGFIFTGKHRIVNGNDVETIASVDETGGINAFNEDPPQEQASTQADAGNDSQLPVDAPDIYELLQYCIRLMAADAWYKMGLIADPHTGLSRKDLNQAKIAIDSVNDLISRLEAAPENEVPMETRRDLRTLLNDLRLNYVNQRNSTEKSELN